MKERGILFNAEMVNAILSGQKTMTRRVVKQKPHPNTEKVQNFFAELWDWLRYDGLRLGSFKCPYGKAGDRFWVKERINYSGEHDNFYYHADNKGCGQIAYDRLKKKTCPSILMPKICHRIMLEITGVRVERLNDISEEDAKAEGAEPKLWDVGDNHTLDYAYGFSDLWLSINGVDSWNENPWVWVVEFKVLEK